MLILMVTTDISANNPLFHYGINTDEEWSFHLKIKSKEKKSGQIFNKFWILEA